MSRFHNKQIWKYVTGAALVMLAVAAGFPILLLNGQRINDQYGTYRRNLRGIYYISVDNPLQLIEVGTYGYLHGVDAKSFVVLADNWAKDRFHVWNGSDIDVATAAYFIRKGKGQYGLWTRGKDKV